MFKDGHQRLRQLLEEEKVMPSPFAPPPVQSVGVATEISGMQGIIDSLQDELTRLRGMRRRTHDGFATCHENQGGRRRRQQILGIDKVWNRGIAPSGWSNLQQVASKEDPGVVVGGGHLWATMILSNSSSAAAGKARSCSPQPSSSLVPLDFLRCRSSKLHIENSLSCIGGRVRSLTQSRHLDTSGEDSWHRRFGSV